MLRLLIFLAVTSTIAYEICPVNKSGTELRCAFRCCESLEGSGSVHGYYCCGADNDDPVNAVGEYERGSVMGNDIGPRADRFVTYGNTFQVDYTLLVIGLIISIVVSIALSLLCCLLCNGCWLHRRRNPQDYESVHDSGFYPICCGFGIPLGTVVFSTHPPQFQDQERGIYNGSSTTSLPSSRNRVRFNEDGTPRGVLKNGGNGNDPHFN
uniref:Uncharacterized protein n=1 Tax=Panagrellus redivivus TaxID=6233 RepID=A0A7E4W8R6_PANRE